MGARHWDDEELISRLYGLSPGDGHLEACEECAERWRRLLAVREQVLARPPVSEDRMARQRQAVYGRLEGAGRGRRWLPYVPATAAAAFLLAAVLLYRPAPVPQPNLTDDEFFSEVYSVARSSEPRAAEPIHALFEVQE